MRLLSVLPFTGIVGCAATERRTDPTIGQGDRGLRFHEEGRTSFGAWQADVTCGPSRWKPGAALDLLVSLVLSPEMLPNMRQTLGSPDAVILLVTSERCFDAGGLLRLPSDERMSTLLTPAGLAIEGGSIGAVSQVTGGYRNPVDQLASLPWASLRHDDAGTHALFHLRFPLPGDIPPGIYRLRCDFGIQARRRRFSLCEDSPFAGRTREAEYTSLAYSPPIGCDGTDVGGKPVDASTIVPRIYAVLLAQYNSNGSRGVVAREDARGFALSNRNIIPDETVLPLYDQRGKRAAYSLEPQFAADSIEIRTATFPGIAHRACSTCG